ncbi:MAG TPA: lipid-binding SYLF domain-containing protein [Terriglobales bacterium]|jgi:lipid-binding SYLF domain-containing protein|nr:lipid-binding SYLF domain-containing protein [Terriglobales bacterium]
MKRLFLSLLLVGFGTVGFAQSDSSGGSGKAATKGQLAEDHPAVSKRLDEATATLKEMFNAPDKGVPSDLLSHAKCVVIIPNEKKAALGIGGNYGRGFATCRQTNNTSQWTAPAPVFLGGGSWGAQLGGESTDILMLVMNDKGVQKLLSSKFKVGVDASAAAGPLGRTVAADTNIKLDSEILTYSRSKGLFAGIDINGATIKQDDRTTKDLYGRMVPFTQILSGQIRTPGAAREFLAEVHRDFAEARASQ